MSFLIHPKELQQCVLAAIETHRNHDNLSTSICEQLFYQYGPYIFRGLHISRDCILFYQSWSECLILFRNRKKHNFLTQISPYCDSYDIVVKGEIKAKSLKQVPAGTIYFKSKYSSGSTTNINQNVNNNNSNKNPKTNIMFNNNDIYNNIYHNSNNNNNNLINSSNSSITLNSGDVWHRTIGTQAQAILEEDTWVLEYIRGYIPIWYTSSLYTAFDKHICSLNLFPCIWQSCYTNCRRWYTNILSTPITHIPYNQEYP